MENKKQFIDVASATVTYIGEADPHVQTSEAKWAIRKVTDNGTLTTIQYAQNRGKSTSNEVHVWDDRASLSYADAPDYTVDASNFNLTAVNVGAAISETKTIATEPVIVVAGNANIGGAVIATTTVYATTIDVTGTAAATANQYTGAITVQDKAGNQKVITASIVVQEEI